MLLTKHTDLSLRVMMHLTLNPDELATVKDIAEIYNVSRNHLVKVVHQLAVLGYVQSVQGRGGGIWLSYSPAEITVGEVVRAMEKTLDLIDCEGTQCPITSKCILKRAVNEATDAFLDVLDSYSIEDLVNNRSQLLRLIG